MRKLYINIIFILICTLLSCTNNINSYSRRNLICNSRRQEISVYIDNQFSSLQKNWISLSLKNLEMSFGLKFNIVYSIENIDLFIKRWYNIYYTPTEIKHCWNTRIGEYTSNTNFILIDPDCVQSQQQFIGIIEHETGHFLGMRHICNSDGLTSDICSTVGIGLAIMNPFFDFDHIIIPTELDRREFRRIRNQVCF